MAVFPKDIRIQVPEGNTAEFDWFSDSFQVCKSLHETTLKILSLDYCTFFSHLLALEK